MIEIEEDVMPEGETEGQHRTLAEAIRSGFMAVMAMRDGLRAAKRLTNATSGSCCAACRQVGEEVSVALAMMDGASYALHVAASTLETAIEAARP